MVLRVMLWSRQYSYLVDKDESAQRQFTKRYPLYSTLDYPTRLKSLEQCSLEKRRIVHDLVLTYKIVFKLVDVQTSIFLHYEMMPLLLEVIHTRFY